MLIVEVEWDDSCSYANQWMQPNDNLEASLCKSVGYLVAKNKNRIVLAQSQHDDSDEVHNQFVIPRGCVKSIRNLT